MTLTAFLVYRPTRIGKRKSSTTCGRLRTTELSIELWSVSALLPRTKTKLHMLCSVATTHLKLLVELTASKLSGTSKTGLVPGHSKVKACSTEDKQCRSQVKTFHTLPSLTQEVLNCQFLPTCSRKSDNSGRNLYQRWTAPQTKPSATCKTRAKMWQPK